MFRAFAAFFEGWATAADGAPGAGLEDMRRGVDLLREQNVLQFDGLLKIALAEAEARASDTDRAIAVLDEALAVADSRDVNLVALDDALSQQEPGVVVAGRHDMLQRAQRVEAREQRRR